MTVSTLALSAVMACWGILVRQGSAEGRREDNSDWWSSYSGPAYQEAINAQPQEREIASSNFQVLGVELAESMFDQAAVKLGKGTLVERGDASTGRDQVCYVSAQGSEKVYLIFEQGEVEFGFYLFTGGPTWHGNDLCAPSNLVSRSTSTESGLHLGLTPAQTIAILGQPSYRRPNELIYSLHLLKKMPPELLDRLRQQHPELGDQELMKSYGEYDLWEGVHLKFVRSKLTYLTIGKSETN